MTAQNRKHPVRKALFIGACRCMCTYYFNDNLVYFIYFQQIVGVSALFVSSRGQYQDCQYFADRKIRETQFLLFTTCQFKLASCIHLHTYAHSSLLRIGLESFSCYLCSCWFLCQFSYTQMPIMPINTDQNENRSAIDFYFV